MPLLRLEVDGGTKVNYIRRVAGCAIFNVSDRLAMLAAIGEALRGRR